MRGEGVLQRDSRPILRSAGHEGARMSQGTDEREHSKGYNVPRPHNALGDRPLSLEAIQGQVSR